MSLGQQAALCQRPRRNYVAAWKATPPLRIAYVISRQIFPSLDRDILGSSHGLSVARTQVDL